MDPLDDADRQAWAAARRGVAGAVVARDVLAVSGPDALEYLHGQVTQDVADMGEGESRWSFVLQPQGKVDALFRLTRIGPDALVLDVDSGWGTELRASLERFKLRTRMEIEPLPWAVLALRGPGSAAAAGRGTGHEITVPLTGPGRPGVDLLGPDPRVAGVTSLSPRVWEALRIEHGVPAMGAEIDAGTIPNETGLLELTVSFSKGCYRGQELVERIHSRGGRRQRLAGLVLDSDTGSDPAAGDEVRVQELDRERAVGRVTSVAWSPGLERPVALAYVRGEVVAGTAITGGRGWSGVAAELPLVDSAGGEDR